ncbi:MAG: hypothetical protein QF441_07015 [Bacteriovoracaceae bacterium]|jgi:hypothetical protein|nr:hypothetical protein [Halobacteriovoraceae bacterium]MDP7320343.1 hypothetical protein [Bacteriovoracaceae bacterium]
MRKIQKFLFSIIIIPVQTPSDFLHLTYSDIKPNTIKIKKEIMIDVNHSASPLFYQFETPKKISQIEVLGEVEIIKNLESEQKDSYFQLGLIYKGEYRPHFFVQKFLPQWLNTVLNINEKFGVSEIAFYHIHKEKGFVAKEDHIRKIKLSFIKAKQLTKENTFSLTIKPQAKKILGLWLRADGDDHNGVFKTKIKKLSFK